MEKWIGPIYKKLASSELGAGHTSGIVPTKATQSYFGSPAQNTSHLMQKILVEFWSEQKSKFFTVNVNYFKSDTHDHIHLTGNLLPAYKHYGATEGDILVFWKSNIDPSNYKAELIKKGSSRWNDIGDEALENSGGFISLDPPFGESLNSGEDSDYEAVSDIDSEITINDFPTVKRKGRRRQEERFVPYRSKAKGDFVLKMQDYKCQFVNTHTSFITKADLVYMEKHHLISMMYYDEYKNDLDDVNNIVSLCPNCHRKIHLGKQEEVGKMLEVLYAQQSERLSQSGLKISIEDLKSHYNAI